jgi:hypothetical protein
MRISLLSLNNMTSVFIHHFTCINLPANASIQFYLQIPESIATLILKCNFFLFFLLFLHRRPRCAKEARMLFLGLQVAFKCLGLLLLGLQVAFKC